MPSGIYKHKLLPEETKRKISEAMKKAWIKFDWSERNRKISKLLSEYSKKIGRIPPSRKGISQNVGEKNGMWKGDKVSRRVLHKWVARHLGQSNTCEYCGKVGLNGHQIHWANRSNRYKRDLKDWLRLCASCHLKYDYKFGVRFR